MAKKPNEIYEPGELNRVRGKLGPIDVQEAKRMAQILGGEVGSEKSAAPARDGSRARRETVELVVPGKKRKRPGRAVEIISSDDDDELLLSRPAPKASDDPADDPSIILKIPYAERIKMDRYAAQFDFEIKNSMQVLMSALTFVGEPVDYVNPRFVTKRMNSYYGKIEALVTSTRGLFPRNNARRSERLKKTSPYVFSILDVIRHWNIEKINADLSKLQARHRQVKATDFADILKAIYKPLFILEKLDIEAHIKGAYKLLYKIIYIENPMETKDKNQDLIRTALTSFAEVRRSVQYLLYPLLMKLISDRWYPYERLFIERRHRYIAFIGASESDQLKPVDINLDQAESAKAEAEQQEEENKEEAESQENKKEEDPDDPKVIERKAKEAAAESDRKALSHSLGVMETLFPEAGWDRLSDYPDFYPYFVNLYGLRRGYELIAPTDPLQQVVPLMHILDDLCVGLRYVTFGSVTGPDGRLTKVEDQIGKIITGWRRYIDDSFNKEYLPRLLEYCRILEHSAESRTSSFAKRTLNELRWSKRLYFLPYYKFESLGPPPFPSQDAITIYGEVRTLRKYLTLVAAGIEQGNRKGGAEAKAPCPGIENPWDPYNFEIPNPVSKRMDALLSPAKKNNAVLVFFALSAATVLDNLINNENSWAYSERPGAIFRSVNGDGTVPQFGVDQKLDADQIFKDAQKRKEEERKKNQA